MPLVYYLVIGCGVLALLYGLVASRQVLHADAGTVRMATRGLALARLLLH